MKNFGGRLRLIIFTIILLIVSIICLIADAELSNDYTEEETTKKKTAVENNVKVVVEELQKDEVSETQPPTQEDKLSCDWSSNDSELLVRIAMAEAGNQSTIGKALVIRVILNRLEDDAFPDTIEEIIYQKLGDVYQFSPVGSGRFDEVEPTEDCWKALELVRQGWDESQGALYFESCANEDNWHSRNLQFLFKEGGHRFYKHKLGV